MKRVGGLFALIIVAVLLVATPGAVLAQGSTDPVCTGLAEADCAILTSSTTAMEGVQSFSIPSFSVDFVLNSVDGETTFNAAGSGHVMVPEGVQEMTTSEGLLLHLVLDSVDYSTPTDSNAGAGEILVRDNMLYVLYNGEWYGGELEAEEEVTDESLEAADVEELEDLQQQIADLGIDMTGVVTSARGADTEAMGQPIANFTTTVDITNLFMAVLQSPAVGEAMGMTGGAEGQEATQEAMTAEDMQMMSAMLAPMFQGTTINISQGIGTEDHLLHSFALDVILNADLSMFDPEVGAVAGTVNVSADLDEFNGAFDIPAPESYRPLEELDQQLGGVTESLGM